MVKCTGTPSPSPITIIPSVEPSNPKCAVGVGYNYLGAGQTKPLVYSYNLKTGERYGYPDSFGFNEGYFRSTALDRSKSILYTILSNWNNDNDTFIAYNIDTEEVILNTQIASKPWMRNIRGLDYNENDGFLYAANSRGNINFNGHLYKVSTDGVVDDKWWNSIPSQVTGLLLSKDYNSIYLITTNATLFNAPLANLSDLTVIPLTIQTNGGNDRPDTIDWYTNNDDEILLICYTGSLPECWTYDLSNTQAGGERLFEVNDYYGIGGIEVLYGDYISCSELIPSCPIKIDIRYITKWFAVIKVLNTDCGCATNIDSFEFIPANKPPYVLETPSWNELTGPAYAFNHNKDGLQIPFQGPFDVRITVGNKILYKENVTDVDQTIIFDFQDNFCDA